jgi:hypothetical protein
MAEFDIGRALAGAAAGFASGATGQNFLTPYLASLAERRKGSKRLGAQKDILAGQAATNPELAEFWDKQLPGIEGEGGTPLTADQKMEIVAGYGPREFDAMHSEAIRFQVDAARKTENEEEREFKAGGAVKALETQFRALGRPLSARGEGETTVDYAARLQGEANADSISYARAAAALDEFQEERAALIGDINETDPKQWMESDIAIQFGNRAKSLAQSAQNELSGFFPGQATRFSDPVMRAYENKAEEARLSTLQERIQSGNYTDDSLHPLFADGARKNGQSDKYSESDYLRAGFGQILGAVAPTYDDVRRLVSDGIEATPELADARQFIVTNELSTKAFNNLPFEQRRQMAELLRKVPPMAVAGARQMNDNAVSRRTNEERFAKALVAAGVQDPTRISGIVQDQRLYQIERGSPDSPLRVEVYQGLAPEGVDKLIELMPDAVKLATQATAWANRVAVAGGLSADQRKSLIEGAVGVATTRRDRGQLTSMERSLELPPDTAQQRAIIGEIVDVSDDGAQTLPFTDAFNALVYFTADLRNLPTGISGRLIFPSAPSSPAGRRKWVEQVIGQADTLRARIESIPEAKGDRAIRARALEALDAIEASPESMIVRSAGAPDLRGPSERLIESVVSGLDEDAINLRTREIASALTEIQAQRTGGMVDESQLVEEEAALQLEQQDIGLMQQAGLSGETRRGILRSLVQSSGDPGTDWEERIQDIGARFGGFDTNQTLPAWAGEAVASLKAADSPTERIVALRELAAKNPDLFYKSSAVPGSGQAGLLVSRAFRGDLDEILAAAADLAETGSVGNKAAMEKKWAVTLPSDYDGHSLQDKALMLIAAGLSARPLTGKPRPAQVETPAAK